MDCAAYVQPSSSFTFAIHIRSIRKDWSAIEEICVGGFIIIDENVARAV